MTISVRPITDDDISRVAEFLHVHMNSRVPLDAWVRSFDLPWTVDKPNSGFMLLDGDTVVGAYTAYYSERTFGERVVHLCNLGTWCVLPDHRFHSIRLLKRLLAQDDYHFTDLSPMDKVVSINKRLGFQFLDTKAVLIPALPWPWRSGRHSVTSDPLIIEHTLTGHDLQLYRDHARASAVRHLLLTRGNEYCYIVFRMVRHKELPRVLALILHLSNPLLFREIVFRTVQHKELSPVFALILHVSNPRLFRQMVLPLSGYLFVHHRAAAMLAELRIIRTRPRFSIRTPLPRKMFLSPTLSPGQIDYFYSELALLPY